MNILGRMWQRLWREFRPEDESEEAVEMREIFARTALRMAAAFALLFGAVFFAFWWSGAAIRFGAARAADNASPTWRISGIVRNSATGQPVAWAAVEDDPAGRPPFYRTDADYQGVYELLTLPEPHRIHVSAPGFRAATVEIGRAWFLWMPHGQEKKDLELVPLFSTPK
jgi:fatty acid desaturase